MNLRSAIFVTLSLLWGCATSTTPATENASWLQWSEPTAAGFDAAALDAARRHADEAKSAGVVIVSHGRIVEAWGDIDRKLDLHSVRKSIYAALWGIAVERGLVDPEATLSQLGIDDLQSLTETEKTARMIDLLQARSGVYHPAAYAPSEQEKERPDRGSHEPGSFWYYNNWDFNVAGAWLERATGRSLGELIEAWIAQPIGMQDFTPDDVFEAWEPGRSQWPALIIRMSARDLARFGELWLRNGRWNGRQIIPAEWVAMSSRPASEIGDSGQGYGVMWWTYRSGAVSAERYPHASRHDIVQASGTGGQAIFVIPDLELVVVHRGDTDHGRHVSGRDVWSILDMIIAAQTGRPDPQAATVSLRAEPLASQLPPLEFPEIVSLNETQRQRILGTYAFAPGMNGRIFLHDGRIFAFMPGKGEAELLPISESAFFVRVDPTVSVAFDLPSEGPARAVRVEIDGRTLSGRRVE